jgi:hypothetical protein
MRQVLGTVGESAAFGEFDRRPRVIPPSTLMLNRETTMRELIIATIAGASLSTAALCQVVTSIYPEIIPIADSFEGARYHLAGLAKFA